MKQWILVCNAFKTMSNRIVSRMWPYCVLLAAPYLDLLSARKHATLTSSQQQIPQWACLSNSMIISDQNGCPTWPLVGRSITFTVIGQNGDLLAPKRHLKPCPLALVSSWLISGIVHNPVTQYNWGEYNARRGKLADGWVYEWCRPDDSNDSSPDFRLTRQRRRRCHIWGICNS